MKKFISFFFCLTLVVLIFNSCKKTPGEGGNAQIKGKVWTEDWDDPFFTYIIHEYPSPNQTVYLYFGDDSSPGTSVKTNDKGEFEFKYLRKGNYKVAVWSKAKQTSSNLNDPKTVAVEIDVTLAKRRDIKDVGTLTIKD